MLAAASGSITAITYERHRESKESRQWRVSTAINGSLVGLVAISAGVSSVYPYGAFCIGGVAGVVYVHATEGIKRWRVDDPIDAISIHLGGGLWGVLAVPFLDQRHGLLYKGNRASLVLIAWNIGGVLLIILWTLLWSSVLFGILTCLDILRVSPDSESRGLDQLVHGEKAYPGMPNHHRTDEAKEVSLASQLSKEEVRRKTEMRIEVPGDEWVENEVKFTEIVAFDGMEESAV
ncbi:putative ammonium transporter sll0108 [Corticium candelabrum]|uniref:putative ammonium transporter sll0108 n=1 Tax=Corticium candelabrum TaxID=121492 RepID=UPI002E25B3EB|nr:putative ammonium transporter sll0108 [Corticium candelabrum]